MKIKVKTYSGYKSDERPVSFFLGTVELEVVEVLDRYYNPDEDIFKVKAVDGGIYILGHKRDTWEEVGDSWQLKGYYRG